MADLKKYTVDEVLGKIFNDGSGTTNIRGKTTGEMLSAALDDTNNRLNIDLQGGTITGDVAIVAGNGESGDLTVAGSVGINEVAPDYKLDVNGSFGFNPGASVTPVDNGDIVIEATDNTTLTFKLKGSDGTVRTGTITLA